MMHHLADDQILALLVLALIIAAVTWGVKVFLDVFPKPQDLGNEDSGFDGETDSILSRRRDDETPIH